MILVPPGVCSAGPLSLLDLQGRQVNPLAPAAAVRATVVIFTSADCPLSNRYAPEIHRLQQQFSSQGVTFWTVYPERSATPDAIRAHRGDFADSTTALRDPLHQLVRLAGATVTPEAALFDARGRLVYHGRIDDRYVNVALQRPAARTHDLEDAVNSLLHGQTPRQPAAPAVGCFIADLDR